MVLVVNPLINCLCQDVGTEHLLSTAEFLVLRDSVSDLILLDVRTPEELESGHIDGAQFLDYRGPEFVEQLEKLDRQRIYVIYCASGIRSRQTCQMMMGMDFDQVYDLRGGYHQFLQDLRDE